MTHGEAVIGEERQVEVTGYSGRTAATVRVVSYDRAQRVRRALPLLPAVSAAHGRSPRRVGMHHPDEPATGQGRSVGRPAMAEG